MTDCLHCELKHTLDEWTSYVAKATGGKVPLNDVVASIALVLGQVIASAENDIDRLVLLMVTRNVLSAAIQAGVAQDAEQAKADEKVTTGGLH